MFGLKVKCWYQDGSGIGCGQRDTLLIDLTVTRGQPPLYITRTTSESEVLVCCTLHMEFF